LGQLQEIAPELTKLGYRIIAISPDGVEKLRSSLEKNEAGFVLLSDSKMKAAVAFGVAFQADDATVKKLKEYGIDLEEASGEKHHQLPVPSVFLVGGSGRIEFQYVNPDYRVRLDPDVLLAAARAAEQ
jgi:peroxiredoxin